MHIQSTFTPIFFVHLDSVERRKRAPLSVHSQPTPTHPRHFTSLDGFDTHWVPFQPVFSCCTSCSSFIQSHCESPSIPARQELLGWETSWQWEKQGLGVMEQQCTSSSSKRQCSLTCTDVGRLGSPTFGLFCERWGLTWVSIFLAYTLEEFCSKVKDCTKVYKSKLCCKGCKPSISRSRKLKAGGMNWEMYSLPKEGPLVCSSWLLSDLQKFFSKCKKVSYVHV